MVYYYLRLNNKRNDFNLCFKCGILTRFTFCICELDLCYTCFSNIIIKNHEYHTYNCPNCSEILYIINKNNMVNIFNNKYQEHIYY